MILTRYHSASSMSAQRIARAGKVSESQGLAWLAHFGSEKKAIAHARKMLAERTPETLRQQVRRMERANGVDEVITRRVWIEAVVDARAHSARRWGISQES